MIFLNTDKGSAKLTGLSSFHWVFIVSIVMNNAAKLTGDIHFTPEPQIQPQFHVLGSLTCKITFSFPHGLL